MKVRTHWARAVVACIALTAAVVGAQDVGGPESREQAPASRAYRVRVVSGTAATGIQPVPRATIDYVVGTELGRARTRTAEDGELDPFMPTDDTGRALIHRVVADSDGLAVLPVASGKVFLRARHGDACGDALFSVPGTLTQDVVIAPPLRVQAVDAAGAPQAGIPVTVTFWRSDALWSNHPRTTGADGIAELPWTRTAGARVAIQLPLAEPVDVPMRTSGAAAALVRLIVPPTGSLVVRLVGADGQPFTADADVSVARHSVGRELRAEFGDERAFDAIVAAGGGVATFPRVGVGVTFDVTVRPESRAFRTTCVTAAGPAIAGDAVTLTVTCGVPALTITGRVLDADRKPVAAARLLACLDPAPPGLWFSGLPMNLGGFSDADGRFALRFNVDPAAVTARAVQLTAAPPDPAHTIDEASNGRMLDVPLAHRPASGTVDVGDIVLLEPPAPPARVFLCAGTVVDDRGLPVVGAWLLVHRRGGAGWGPGWRRAWELSGYDAVTDGDGHFEIDGPAVSGELGVSVRSGPDWSRAETIPLTLGARDVRLIVTRLGSLEGSIAGLRPDTVRHGFTPDDVRVTCAPRTPRPAPAPDDDEHEGVDTRDGSISVTLEGGSLGAKSLLPGEYDVSFFVGRARMPTLVVDGVTVRPGEATRDPRMQEIAPNRLLVVRTVTVTDDAGAPVPSATVAAWITSGRNARRIDFLTRDDGPAIVATPAASVDVLVTAPFHRSVSITGVTGDRTIMLTKAPPLRVVLTLDPAVELPEPPLYLRVRLAWAGPGGPIAEFDDRRNDLEQGHGARFGTDRTATVHVRDPGTYVPSYSVMRGGAGGTTTVPVHTGKAPVTTITVADGPAPTSVTVSVPAADLRLAVRQATRD